MVGNIEFHHAFAQSGQTIILRMDNHALLSGRCAGGRRAAPSLDFHETKATGAKGLQRIRGT